MTRKRPRGALQENTHAKESGRQGRGDGHQVNRLSYVLSTQLCSTTDHNALLMQSLPLSTEVTVDESKTRVIGVQYRCRDLVRKSPDAHRREGLNS